MNNFLACRALQAILKFFIELGTIHEDPNLNDWKDQEHAHLLLVVNNSLLPKNLDSRFHSHFKKIVGRLSHIV